MTLKLVDVLLLLWLCSISSVAFSQEDPYYSVYLIGDAGAPVTDGADPVFTNLQKRLDKEGENSAIIFLGDNVYYNGLPPKNLVEEEENRRDAEKKLLVQLHAVNDFKGKIFFIPGNHDWNDAHPDGIDYVRAQEEYIEFFLDRGDVMIPDHGCPGPEVKKLGKDIVLIALDSQWWLHPHTDKQNEDSDCKNRNIEAIIQELKELLERYEDEQIIIALHHPIYSDGSHNGYFVLREHIFPLRFFNPNLWIPLPVLGSLHPFFRSTFGVPQDMPHPSYKRLREAINEALIGRKNVVLASGHEHNLQYFYKKNNHFIKSGSGSKSSALPKKTEALFSDESKGYAVLSYYKTGEVNLRYFTIEGTEEVEKYSEAIVKATPQFGPGELVYDIDPSPVSRSASDLYDKKGFHRFIFGNLYREDWQTEVAFRKLNLSKELGGLKPLKIGGGMSSRSIRLESRDDKQYVLRSVEKGVSKVVPELFQNSVVQDIFQDQIAASQPYAALVVPPLADAVGVYHTNPEIVYLPRQPFLGDYNDAYGGQLYLFEERPSGNQEDVEDLGGSHKIISYSKMLQNLRSSSKYHIHQKQVLKSRLLDIYLGDWDRHDDQWRWATFKERQHEGGDETHTSYEPIPRDRDQVMFKYQGFIPWIGKLLSPELRKFQTFGPDIKNLKYLAYNARHFDRSYLNQLEKEEWIELAEEMTTQLSDEVIKASIDALPDPIKELRSAAYTEAFKTRKFKLREWATEHYKFLAKYVDVVGTNKNEFFSAERTPDNKVKVQVFQKKKDGELDDLMYERTFHHDETKEIRLYGLAGKDSFAISGIAAKGPLIRVIGGKGNDVLSDQSELKSGKSLVVYDKLSDNGMEPGKDGKDKRSMSYSTNNYDRMEYYYNSSIGIPFIGFNPDDGLILQYKHSLSTYGYRKYPYKAKHDIGFRYAFNSDQLSFDYTGHFVDVAGKADLGIEAFLHLPDNISNFFGLSNTKTFSVNEFDDFDFFRYERTDIKIKPSLIWSTENDVSRIQVGPYFRFINVGDNEESFVRDFDASGLSEASFETDSFLGIEASYRLNKVDNIAYPTTGIDFEISPSYNININNSEEKFTRLHGSLTLYNYLWIPKPFVLASKIEGGVNWGEFNFYQAEYIGLDNGLRGFRSNRFGGKSSLLFTNDLRLELGTLKGAFPLTIGLIGAYDFGRVWNDNEVNTRWHQSYGGGFFISPFDVMPISFYFMKSTEETSTFMFKFGFAI